jgi:hypothetical protein
MSVRDMLQEPPIYLMVEFGRFPQKNNPLMFNKAYSTYVSYLSSRKKKDPENFPVKKMDVRLRQKISSITHRHAYAMFTYLYSIRVFLHILYTFTFAEPQTNEESRFPR